MNETGLKIRVAGDPVLRKKAKKVGKVNAGHARTLSLMARKMYESKGIGLAAPQVGINESLIVVDIGSGLYKLINPRIVKKEGAQTMEEGCLSVPGIYIKVKRARKVKVCALDENAQEVVVDAEGLLACVLQHEIDHLLGKLIVDYASMFKRLSLQKKLERLQNEQLSEPEGKPL